MSSNSAAWLVKRLSHPFQIKEAPIWKPEADEILVKNHAVAINPIDGAMQAHELWPLTYPTILGEDIAGEVVAVGSNVTRFKVGDRVLGNSIGVMTRRLEHSGFQAYTVVPSNLASPIPDDLTYEQATVLPVGLSTAACALFQDDFFKLNYPTEPRSKPTGQVLLVWGGASSVGSNAIQLAVAAGYEVYTTASAKNFSYVKGLGAAAAFDYNTPTVVDDLVNALKGKPLVGGFDCIGPEATAATVEVIQRSEGVKLVASTKGVIDVEGVSVKMVIGSSLKDNDVGKAIYEDFLPKALNAKTYSAVPEPLVVGSGLESIQEAVDVRAKGTSARKVVVSL